MENKLDIIILKEHQKLSASDREKIEKTDIKFEETPYLKAPKYLGITPDYKASYYIGADWLLEDLPIAVTPKMKNIDYMKMFLCALDFELPSDYFSLFYGIDLEKKEIVCEGLKDEVTPLLIVHFLSTVKRLLKKGLKKDYVLREENLNSKIKGHIQISRNFKFNVIPQRQDRTYCRFQEYTLDHPENRLIKKALLFVERYLSMNPIPNYGSNIRSLLNGLLTGFEMVSDLIDVGEINSLSNYKLHREHTEALKLAKQILKRFSYSIHEISCISTKVPAFWIDMSRLYEVYVYSLLHRTYGDLIDFQIRGYKSTAVDFIKKDQELIIDTKYKPHYNEGNRGLLDDIRQISGYSRDSKILEKLYGQNLNDNRMPHCLLIIPDNNNDITTVEDDEKDKVLIGFDGVDLINDAVRIKSFVRFYKLSVPLPSI